MTESKKPVGNLSQDGTAGDDEFAVEPEVLAAYLEDGLSESEKSELHGVFASSPAALADLKFAIALQEETEGSTLRPPEAVTARARAILAEGVKMVAPPQVPARSWFAMPWFRVAAGFAAVAIVAVVVFRSQLPGPGQPSAPSLASNPSDSDSRSAMLPGQVAGPANVSPPVAIGHWGALAVSKSTKAYGVAQRAGSREQAEKAALADCAARQGTNCVVAEVGAGQCFAVAREIDGPPVTAAAANIETVRKRALDACTTARKEIFPCAVQFSFCAEK